MRNDAGVDLQVWLNDLLQEAEAIASARAELDSRDQEVASRIEAVKTLQAWKQGTGKSRWNGTGVFDAVIKIRQEHPGWGHAEIRDQLLEDHFDFQGKNPGLSVNQALVRMRRGAK